MEIRNKLIALLYLIFLVLYVQKNSIIRENQNKIDTFDKVKSELDSLTTAHDYLVKRNKVVEKYANGFGYDIDWDKAIELNEDN